MKGIEALDKIEKYVQYIEIEKYNNKKLFKKIDKGCEDKNDFFYCHYIIYSELQKLEKLEKVLEIIKEHFFLENYSDFISINGRLDKVNYNVNEINLLKEVFGNE